MLNVTPDPDPAGPLIYLFGLTILFVGMCIAMYAIIGDWIADRREDRDQAAADRCAVSAQSPSIPVFGKGDLLCERWKRSVARTHAGRMAQDHAADVVSK